jgi:hypothetical protein
MQKLITVTINVEKLQTASQGAFTLTEIEEINDLLEDGWNVEEWEFISSEQESEKAVLLVILNNELDEADFDAEIFSMENEPEEDEDEEEGDEEGREEMEGVSSEENEIPSVH